MDCRTAQQNIMAYIERKLSDREMEEFIEHIRECKTCSEELEVYFTIYYALENLDDKGQESFDIKDLLEKDLKNAEHRISNRSILKFYRRLFVGLLALIAAVLLITGAQVMIKGSFEETTLYSLFGNALEEENSQITHKPEETQERETKPQQETNRKNQVIVTTPETERWLPETVNLE